MCEVLTGARLVRRTSRFQLYFSSTLTHPAVTCTTIPIFNNVFKSFKIFTSLDMN